MCRTYKDLPPASAARARRRDIDRAACTEYAFPADDRIAAVVAAWESVADDVGYFYVGAADELREIA